jgi:hypothetical protein
VVDAQLGMVDEVRVPEPGSTFSKTVGEIRPTLLEDRAVASRVEIAGQQERTLHLVGERTDSLRLVPAALGVVSQYSVAIRGDFQEPYVR